MFKIAIIAYTSITLFPLLVEFFLRKYESLYSRNNSYYTCYFSSIKNRECKQHIYKKAPCSASCSYIMLKNIVYFILSSKESVSMCLFLLTSSEVCDAIITCHNQGKKVRIILDDKMWGCSGSKGIILHKNGSIVF